MRAIAWLAVAQSRAVSAHLRDRGLHSGFHVPSVQRGSAAMPVPSATGDQASALAP
jgi:hypothetical protein